MDIPFLNLKRESERYGDGLLAVVSRVVNSGWYILGEEKIQFERKFAAYCGAKHCIGVGNGLDALRLILLGYKELGRMKDGDEVILPANTFIATALAVTQAGLTPVLADCDSRTYNIDAKSVETKITKRTRAIIMVHLYGQIADVRSLKELAERNNLLLIDDSAQAHGAMLHGEKTGALGDATAFSFYPVKNLGAMGDAGAVVTQNDDLAEVVRSMSNYGSDTKYMHKYKGINSRLDELQAAVLSYKLDFLDEENEKRRQIAKKYTQDIKNIIVTTPPDVTDQSHVFHQYVVRCKYRDLLQKHLSDKGIQTQIHYPIAIHKQEAYSEMKGVYLPISEALQDEVLSIPIYPSLSDQEIAHIVDCTNNFKY